MSKKLSDRALAKFETERDVWQEVLDGVREIKAGGGKRTKVWDSIVQEDAELSVSEEKRVELRRRKERFLKHASSGRTWERVKQRARTQND